MPSPTSCVQCVWHGRLPVHVGRLRLLRCALHRLSHRVPPELVQGNAGPQILWALVCPLHLAWPQHRGVHSVRLGLGCMAPALENPRIASSAGTRQHTLAWTHAPAAFHFLYVVTYIISSVGHPFWAQGSLPSAAVQGGGCRSKPPGPNAIDIVSRDKIGASWLFHSHFWAMGSMQASQT